MTSVSFADFHANLAKHCDAVEGDQTELVVTRGNRKSVVVISAREWESIQETLFLLADPANRDHLRESMGQAERGELEERDLIRS